MARNHELVPIQPVAARKVQEQALKAEHHHLHNRINELGVAEPVIQQQGLDRIVVQLPGVQDTAKAKDILGRTATLELRHGGRQAPKPAAELARARAVRHRSATGAQRQAVIVKKQVILTGENLTDAQPGFDGRRRRPKVRPDGGRQGRAHLQGCDRENLKSAWPSCCSKGQGRGADGAR